jgi:hypothetical protein
MTTKTIAADLTSPAVATTTYPPINYAALQRIFDRIDANPDFWHQEKWHCDTSHCLGGLAQLDAGLDEHASLARQQARVHLGFTRAEADYYFAPERTLEELKAALEPLHAAGFDRDGFDDDGLNIKNKKREELKK